MAELTDLGKCLMKHEVGGGAGEIFSLPSQGARFHFSHFLMPSGGFFGNTPLYELKKTVGKAQGHCVPMLAWAKAQKNTQAHCHQSLVFSLPQA